MPEMVFWRTIPKALNSIVNLITSIGKPLNLNIFIQFNIKITCPWKHGIVWNYLKVGSGYHNELVFVIRLYIIIVMDIKGV